MKKSSYNKKKLKTKSKYKLKKFGKGFENFLSKTRKSIKAVLAKNNTHKSTYRSRSKSASKSKSKSKKNNILDLPDDIKIEFIKNLDKPINLIKNIKNHNYNTNTISSLYKNYYEKHYNLLKINVNIDVTLYTVSDPYIELLKIFYNNREKSFANFEDICKYYNLPLYEDDDNNSSNWTKKYTYMWVLYYVWVCLKQNTSDKITIQEIINKIYNSCIEYIISLKNFEKLFTEFIKKYFIKDKNTDINNFNNWIQIYNLFTSIKENNNIHIFECLGY